MIKPHNYDEIVEFAKKYGFETKWSVEKGYSFQRGNTKIWPCADCWQVADLIEGYFKNHRPSKSLKEALEKEGLI